MSSSQSSLEEGQIPAIGQADPPDSEGEQQWLPDIIIAIDLGLTYTGVAYSTLSMKKPGVIFKWPGTTTKVEYKVPTKVCYRAGSKRCVKWGFECPPPEDMERGMSVLDCFKLFLDPEYFRDAFEQSPQDAIWTKEDVRMWFIDFLRELRKHVVDLISKELGRAEKGEWEATRVEYNFTYPTTWKDTEALEEFREIVAEAGYGDRHDSSAEEKRHTVRIDLTEAEAAAVYTAGSSKHQHEIGLSGVNTGSVGKRSRIQKDNTLLICDSGGGTTDVSVLKVESVKNLPGDGEQSEETLQLRQLDFVKGDAVGSVQIDETCQREVERRLDLIRHQDDEDPHFSKNAAHELAKGRPFQAIKIGFGENVSALENSHLRIRGLARDFNHTGAKIQRGKIVFTKDEIQAMFDPQIDRIFNIIDKQLQSLQDKLPSEKVSHFVISGGLGSSPYVQRRIREKYDPNGQKRQILISADPQLAVCKGLAIHRVHRLKYGYSILSERFCRESYGIRCYEPLGRRHKKHGEFRRQEIAGKKYASRIHWFVKEGQPVGEDEAQSRKFQRVINPASSNIVWHDTIVKSRAPANRLPLSIDEGDAKIVDKIKATLDLNIFSQGQDNFETHRRLLGKSYTTIKYDVLVRAGSTDLTFDIHFAGRDIGERKSIKVDWWYTSDSGGRIFARENKETEEEGNIGCYGGPIASRGREFNSASQV